MQQTSARQSVGACFGRPQQQRSILSFPSILQGIKLLGRAPCHRAQTWLTVKQSVFCRAADDLAHGNGSGEGSGGSVTSHPVIAAHTIERILSQVC